MIPTIQNKIIKTNLRGKAFPFAYINFLYICQESPRWASSFFNVKNEPRALFLTMKMLPDLRPAAALTA